MNWEEFDARLDRIASLIEAERLASEQRDQENAKAIEANRLSIEANRLSIEASRASMEELKEQFEKDREARREEVKRWDERFFQLSRDNLNLSRSIIVTAGAAVIFAPFLQAVVPAILALIKNQA